MSDEATHSSSLGVEEIIATISVLLLASIFIGYYLWPSNEPVAGASQAVEESEPQPVVVSSETGARENQSDNEKPQTITLSGETSAGSKVSAEINGNEIGKSVADNSGNWSLSTQTTQQDTVDIEINASASRSTTNEYQTETSTKVTPDTAEKPISTSRKTETSQTQAEISTSTLADINDATVAESEPIQTAMIEQQPEVAPAEAPVVDATVDATADATGFDITEPVITYLDRDRTNDELILSGSAPESDQYIVLLINGTTTQPVKLDAKNRWRYRFKAGPGEYYVRVTPATETGSQLRPDALPTLYNISLAPVTPDSSEAGAEISLLPGEFITLEKGQNLFQVSQKTGIKISDLMLVNGITDEKSMKTGDILFVPTGN